MPKTNKKFWRKKFAENIARDQRVAAELAEMNYRTLVVWECELKNNTIQIIERSAAWLKNDKNLPLSKRRGKGLDRDDLLAVAEKKVRRRIAGYGVGDE